MSVPHDWPAFITAHTELLSPPLVPELKLHLAHESLAIWRLTEDELAERNVPPPYWAFAWAGGQALARFLLDNRAVVEGRRVVDLGTGSGLTALAAAKAGARSVLAADIDEIAAVATVMNAEVNGLAVSTTTDNLLATDTPPDGDLLLVGDLFYERSLADRALSIARAFRDRGGDVLVGDPGRSYFPRTAFACLATYEVPVTRELEDNEIKRTSVWKLA